MTSATVVKTPPVVRPVPIKARPIVVYRDSGWFAAARFILISSLLLAPLAFGAVQPWGWGVLAILSVFAMLCWAMGCLRQEGMVLAWTPLYLPPFLFLVLGIAQLAGGQTVNRVATRDSIIMGCVYLILFALAATLFGNAALAHWLRLGKIVTAFTFLLSIFAIVQFFSSPDKIYWTVVPRWGGSIFGPYVNHNHYAGLMEMLVAITASFWVNRQRHDIWNWLAGFATLLALASVALSGSRSGVASVLLEMVLLLAVALLAQYRQNRLHNPVPALAFSFLCAALLAAWIMPQEVTAHLQSAVHVQDASFEQRMAMARDSLRIFSAHPLAGTGLGSFETAYPEFQTLVTDLRVDHAHNDYAEALAETGIIGGLLMAAGLGMFLWINVKNFRGPLMVAGNTIVWLRLGATIGCLGLLVHSFFDFNLHIPANAAWFVVLAALGSVEPEAPSPTGTVISASGPSYQIFQR
jgi:O-antigen ligase